MSHDAIPADVRQLLREHLTGFERLEIALLLRAHPHEDWDVAALTRQTGIAAELALEALQGLKAAGLIATPAGNALSFRYGPANPARAAAMDRLARVYREQRAAVMSLMSVQAIERIRSRSIRAFADSFVFTRKKSDR